MEKETPFHSKYKYFHFSVQMAKRQTAKVLYLPLAVFLLEKRF